MSGTSRSSLSSLSSKLLSCSLLTFLAVAGAACKQDVGERCEVTEDCSDPDLNECKNANTSVPGAGGTCQPRGADQVDAGVPPDAGTEAGASGDVGSTEGGADATAETAGETAGDSPPASDGATDASDVGPADAPASEAAADLPSADLATEGG